MKLAKTLLYFSGLINFIFSGMVYAQTLELSRKTISGASSPDEISTPRINGLRQTEKIIPSNLPSGGEGSGLSLKSNYTIILRNLSSDVKNVLSDVFGLISLRPKETRAIQVLAPRGANFRFTVDGKTVLVKKVSAYQAAANVLYDWKKGEKTPDVLSYLISFLVKSPFKARLSEHITQLSNVSKGNNDEKLSAVDQVGDKIGSSLLFPLEFRNESVKLFAYGAGVLKGNRETASCHLSDGQVLTTVINTCNELKGLISGPCVGTRPKRVSKRLFYTKVALAQEVSPSVVELKLDPDFLDPDAFKNQRDPKDDLEKSLSNIIKGSGISDKPYVPNKYDCDDYSKEVIDYLRKNKIFGVSWVKASYWGHYLVDFHGVGRTIYIEPQNGRIYDKVPVGTIDIIDDPNTPNDEVEDAFLAEQKIEEDIEKDRKVLEDGAQKLNEINKREGIKAEYSVEHDSRLSIYDMKLKILE